jgi:hypothetical protein
VSGGERSPASATRLAIGLAIRIHTHLAFGLGWDRVWRSRMPGVVRASCT